MKAKHRTLVMTNLHTFLSFPWYTSPNAPLPTSLTKVKVSAGPIRMLVSRSLNRISGAMNSVLATPSWLIIKRGDMLPWRGQISLWSFRQFKIHFSTRKQYMLFLLVSSLNTWIFFLIKINELLSKAIWALY